MFRNSTRFKEIIDSAEAFDVKNPPRIWNILRNHYKKGRMKKSN